MPCKLCKSKPVWKFTNKRQLCASCFTRYFEKKVRTTIRKYNIPIYNIGGSLKAKVIGNITKGIIKNLPQKKGKLSAESLNDISTKILYIMMHDNKDKLKTLLPRNQPLYFLSNKEILLYAKIKGIKGRIEEKKGKMQEIDNFIKLIEKKNPDIRHNIVIALSYNLL
jgi:hypothetical protein